MPVLWNGALYGSALSLWNHLGWLAAPTCSTKPAQVEETHVLLHAVGNTFYGLDPKPVRIKSFHQAQWDSDRANNCSHLCSGIKKGGFMDFLAPPVTKRCSTLLFTFHILSSWVYFSAHCGMFLVWSEWWLTVRCLSTWGSFLWLQKRWGFTSPCWATSFPWYVLVHKGCVCETVKPETFVLPNCRNKKLSVITAGNKSPLLGIVWTLKFFTRSCSNVSMYK